MNISLPALGTSPIDLVPQTGASSPGGFAQALSSAVNDVETAQSSAKAAAEALLVGGRGDVHTVALASQQASLSLEMFQQVRNKFVSAYQEIMKMPM